MAVLTPVAKMQFLDATGAPLVGGLLYTYAAGTTTPQASYTDSTGAQANTNPVVLDARGEANIWLASATYKFKLASSDNTELWTVDNISAPTSSLSPVLSGNVTIDSDSAGPALKITQTGTGPVLRVQDSIDPDVTPFIIDSTGQVGIGTQSPSTAFDVNDGVIQLSSSGVSRTTISADASNSTIDSPSTRGLILSTGGAPRITIASGGGVTFSGAVTASGGATITGNVAVTGTLSSTSTLTVSSGGAAITGNSTVTGTLTSTSTLIASNGLTVSAGGATVTAGGLTVSSGGAAITGNSTVTGTLTSTSTLTAQNGLTVSAGGAGITGNSTVTGTLNATSTLTAQNGLTVSTGGASITGNSTVTGTLNATSTLTAQNGLTVSAGGAGITGLLTANSGVSVTGTVTATTFTGAWTNLPAGTVMLFVQTSAPTGWTKSTAHDNKALRVVSGAASSGGSVAFTTAFASQGVSGTVGSYTLTTADIPSHSHSATSTDSGHTHGYWYPTTVSRQSGSNTNCYTEDTPTNNKTTATGNASITTIIGNTGGDGGHSHSFTGTAINLAVQYVDVIIATKD
jgi:hypothetical protein